MSARNLMFSTIPETNVQYSDFDLSHDVKLSLNAGTVIPLDIRECLPGETHDIDISSFVRMAPMVFPVMHQIQVFTHTFFVPNRLVYQSWNKFIWQGEGKTKQTTPLPLTNVQPPTFKPLDIYNALQSLSSPTIGKLPFTQNDINNLVCYFFFGPKYLNKSLLTEQLAQLYQYLYYANYNYATNKGKETLIGEATLLPEYLGLNYNIDIDYIGKFSHALHIDSDQTNFAGLLDINEYRDKVNQATSKDESALDYATLINNEYEAIYTQAIGRDFLKQLYDLTPNAISLATYLLLEGNLNRPISALPFRAYHLIWDSFYRYEPIQEQKLDWSSDILQSYEVLYYYFCKPRAWEHDYFTSALPSRQKGQALAIPVSEISIRGTDSTGQGDLLASKDTYAIGDNKLYQESTAQLEFVNKATALVNDLRTAIKLQSFNELFARCGSRVYEALKGIFNVTSQDARLDVPEYINGSSMPIQISEVTQTSASTDTSSLGDYAGHGVGADRSDHIHYETNEHGFLITLVSIRPKSEYMDRLDKMWYRLNYLDYAWPQLATLGEQEITNGEIMSIAEVGKVTDRNKATFGYIPRYSEHKYAFDRILGDFRSSSQFQSWTMARRFNISPNLGPEFININQDTNRVFSYTEFNYDHYYMQVHIEQTGRLPLPIYSDPTF